MTQRHIWLIVFVFLTLAGGFLSGQFVAPNLGWYGHLVKPPLNPPSDVFAPVWSILYILTAVAGWRLLRASGKESDIFRLWLLQLGINLGWTPVFFGLHAPFAALLHIIALFTLVSVLQIAAWRTDRTSFWLLLPYQLWVGFASYLSGGIWYLN